MAAFANNGAVPYGGRPIFNRGGAPPLAARINRQNENVWQPAFPRPAQQAPPQAAPGAADDPLVRFETLTADDLAVLAGGAAKPALKPPAKEAEISERAGRSGTDERKQERQKSEVVQNERNAQEYYRLAAERWKEASVFAALAQNAARRQKELRPRFPAEAVLDTEITLPSSLGAALRFAAQEEGVSIYHMAECLETSPNHVSTTISKILYQKIADLARITAAIHS
jgi:hypothetical protein